MILKTKKTRPSRGKKQVIWKQMVGCKDQLLVDQDLKLKF